MAGCGAYSKIEGFAFLPITSFTMALTTFVGQNSGAKEYERTKKELFWDDVSYASGRRYWNFDFLFAPALTKAFNNDPQVIQFGVERARTSALFFLLLAYSHCVSAILRGVGKSSIPMFVMLVCWCVIRVSILMFLLQFSTVFKWYIGYIRSHGH